MISELAWAAGLVDGEGCIAVERQKGAGPSHSYHLRISVEMIHKPTLIKLREILKFGTVVPVNGRKGGRTIWRWRVGGYDAFWLLDLLAPYLVTKRAEADLALKFHPWLSNGRKYSIYLGLRELKRREYRVSLPGNSDRIDGKTS